MTMWFDTAKQRYRISFKDSSRRRTKLLPAGVTEEEARAAHTRFCGEVYMGRLAVTIDTETRWAESVGRASTRPGSWMHNALKGAKQRAKSRGLPFELDMASLSAMCERSAGRCEVTGIEFSEIAGRGRMRPFVPSIDRREPPLGYTVANCRLVCACVNVAMFTWGETVFKAMAIGFTMGEMAKANGLHMPKLFTPLHDAPAQRIPKTPVSP